MIKKLEKIFGMTTCLFFMLVVNMQFMEMINFYVIS